MIVCTEKDPEGFFNLILYRVGMHKIVETDGINLELKKHLEEYKNFSYNNMNWSEMQVVTISNHENNFFKFDYVFNLIYDEVLVTRAVQFQIELLRRDSNGHVRPDFLWLKPLDELDFSPHVRLGAHLFNIANMYIIYNNLPKFEMLALMKGRVIEYPYIDTNDILVEYHNTILKLIIFIYRRIEDSKVYFILFYVTSLQERQVVRHEEMAHYSDTLRINIIRLINSSIFIMIFDYTRKTILKSYVYNMVAQLVGTLTDSIVINGYRIPLNLEEDEVFSLNNFKILKPLVVDLNRFDKETLVLRIFSYLSVEGNIINMIKPEGGLPKELNDLVRFDNYLFASNLPHKIGTINTLLNNKIKILFNSRVMVGNFNKMENFEVFLSSSHESYARVDFKFNTKDVFCKEMLLSDKHLFCLFFGGNKAYIKANSLSRPKETIFMVQILSIEMDITLLEDNDEYLLIIMKYQHKRSLRIDKINKRNLHYEYINIDTSMMGRYDMNLVSSFFHFDIPNKIITIISFSNLRNILIIFSATVNIEILNISKLKTLNDAFEMNPIDVNILTIRCRSVDSNLKFECLLAGMNFIHEISLTRNFGNSISLYTWKLDYLFNYSNVFFTEISLEFSEFNVFFSEHYFIIYMNTAANDFPGQFAVYHRHRSRFCLDYENFESFNAFDEILDFDFQPEKNIITVIGSKKTELLRMNFKVQPFFLRVENPHKFVGQTIPFEFEFYNKNKFNLAFKIIDTSLTEQSSDMKRKMFLYMLFGTIILSFFLIFGLLIYTVFLWKKKDALTLRLDDESNEDALSNGSFRVSDMKISKRN